MCSERNVLSEAETVLVCVDVYERKSERERDVCVFVVFIVESSIMKSGLRAAAFFFFSSLEPRVFPQFLPSVRDLQKLSASGKTAYKRVHMHWID